MGGLRARISGRQKSTVAAVGSTFCSGTHIFPIKYQYFCATVHNEISRRPPALFVSTCVLLENRFRSAKLVFRPETCFDRPGGGPDFRRSEGRKIRPIFKYVTYSQLDRFGCRSDDPGLEVQNVLKRRGRAGEARRGDRSKKKNVRKIKDCK